MGKKFLYNILLNIGILILAYCAIAAFHARQYLILACAIAGIALLIYLKIRLTKQVRKMLKGEKKP